MATISRKAIRAEVDRRLAAGEITADQHAACVAQMDAADGTVHLPKGWEIWERAAIRDGDDRIPRWATEKYYILDSRTDMICGGATPKAAARKATGLTELAFDTLAHVVTR